MPTVVHVDIASDDPARARKFYETVFDWKIEATPFEDYYMVSTQDMEGKPGLAGGLGKRGDPSQKITVYVGVDSIDAFTEKIKQAGGSVVQPKMPVTGMGYLASFLDTEGNMFGIWQEDSAAS